MDDVKLAAIVDAIVRELQASGAVKTNGSDSAAVSSSLSAPSAVPVKSRTAASTANLSLDLPDPTLREHRYRARVKNPKDANGLRALMDSTTARIGVGRAGPRYSTASLLLFQGDHAVTQDALYRDVDQTLLDQFNLFTVQTKITGGKQEYLLRPDLGRLLNDDAKRIINEKCQKNVNIQLCVGDGLSAAAIEANLRQIFPVIKQGVQNAGLTFGTPFFIKYARVGVMNDVGELIKPDVVILLIGERPPVMTLEERVHGVGGSDQVAQRLSAIGPAGPAPGAVAIVERIQAPLDARGEVECVQPEDSDENVSILARLASDRLRGAIVEDLHVARVERGENGRGLRCGAARVGSPRVGAGQQHERREPQSHEQRCARSMTRHNSLLLSSPDPRHSLVRKVV